MKAELLQSISVIVLIAGLFLSALGGFGAYYFGGRSGPSDDRQTAAAVEIAEPDLPVREDETDARLASIVEPVAVPPEHPTPPEPRLPPVTADPIEELPLPAGEKMDEPADAAPVIPPEIMLEPEPAVSTTAIPLREPPAESPPPRLEGLGIEPWQLAKLLQRLRAFKNGTIAIQAPEGAGEALRYAGALKEAFVAAGWSVIGVDSVKTSRDPKGITLSSGTFPPPTEVTTVFGSLITAGIKIGTDLDPSLGKQHAVIFVGSRP